MATRVQTVKETTTREDRPAEVEPVSSPGPALATRIIWFIAGVILILLGFRFILSLLGANRANGFADFIYSVSHPFVAPFFGLFNYNVVNYGVSRFELYTLIAMLVYAIIAWGLTALVNIANPVRD